MINRASQQVLWLWKQQQKQRRKPKFSRKKQEEKVEAIWNHKLFSESFIYDPLIVFFKQIGFVIF